MSGGGGAYLLIVARYFLGRQRLFFRSSLRTEAPGENGKISSASAKQESHAGQGTPGAYLRAIFVANEANLTIAASLARYKTRDKVLVQNA